MLKKLAVSAVFTLFLSSFTHAENAGYNELPVNDTTDLTDSADLVEVSSSAYSLQDPKQGFKDLFVSSPSAGGMNVAQLNPMAIGFVQDYVDRFRSMMESLKDWGKPYFDMMDAVLTTYGLPKELKYLAVIESHLKSNARSWAGAVGPWQFMPTTARNMGLKISKKYDERRDYTKSTHAASKYLAQLYALYGDWLLVIAAYNGGPGRVNAAIKKSGSKDFWSLQQYLPAESRNHVKKFIATHYIMEGQGGVTTLTKGELSSLPVAESIVVVQQPSSAGDAEKPSVQTQTISGRYNSKVIAKYVEMDWPAFNQLNPTLDKVLASTTTYQLKLPEDKMKLFFSRKNDILSASVQMLLNPDYQL